MKKPILTLAVLSSALNLNQTLASELTHSFFGKENRMSVTASTDVVGEALLAEIPNSIFRREIELAVRHLVFVGGTSGSSFHKEEEGDALAESLLSLKDKVAELEYRHPELASSVKAKILAEMLRTGVVVIDEEESSRLNRVQVALNGSILEKLEERQDVLNAVAGNGTICL